MNSEDTEPHFFVEDDEPMIDTFETDNINKTNLELKGQNNEDIMDSKVKKDDIQRKELGINRSSSHGSGNTGHLRDITGHSSNYEVTNG